MGKPNNFDTETVTTKLTLNSVSIMESDLTLKTKFKNKGKDQKDEVFDFCIGFIISLISLLPLFIKFNKLVSNPLNFKKLTVYILEFERKIIKEKALMRGPHSSLLSMVNVK